MENVIEKLNTAVASMTEAAEEIRRYYAKGDARLESSDQLLGAAGMILSWINDIKSEDL